jgi:hypothetical protein
MSARQVTAPVRHLVGDFAPHGRKRLRFLHAQPVVLPPLLEFLERAIRELAYDGGQRVDVVQQAVHVVDGTPGARTAVRPPESIKTP